MKLSSKCFTFFASYLSLFTINCAFSMSAKAAIVCEPGTINNYILFDDKGQFKSCELSETIQIRTGNSIETCQAEFMVDVSISENGKQSITCHQLR